MTRIAAIQTAASQDRDANLAQAEHLIRGAVRDGAQLVLLPEIFAAPFVAPEPDLGYFEWAEHPDELLDDRAANSQTGDEGVENPAAEHSAEHFVLLRVLVGRRSAQLVEQTIQHAATV